MDKNERFFWRFQIGPINRRRKKSVAMQFKCGSNIYQNPEWNGEWFKNGKMKMTWIFSLNYGKIWWSQWWQTIVMPNFVTTFSLSFPRSLFTFTFGTTWFLHDQHKNKTMPTKCKAKTNTSNNTQTYRAQTQCKRIVRICIFNAQNFCFVSFAVCQIMKKRWMKLIPTNVNVPKKSEWRKWINSTRNVNRREKKFVNSY